MMGKIILGLQWCKNLLLKLGQDSLNMESMLCLLFSQQNRLMMEQKVSALIFLVKKVFCGFVKIPMDGINAMANHALFVIWARFILLQKSHGITKNSIILLDNICSQWY